MDRSTLQKGFAMSPASSRVAAHGRKSTAARRGTAKANGNERRKSAKAAVGRVRPVPVCRQEAPQSDHCRGGGMWFPIAAKHQSRRRRIRGRCPAAPIAPRRKTFRCACCAPQRQDAFAETPPPGEIRMVWGRSGDHAAVYHMLLAVFQAPRATSFKRKRKIRSTSRPIGC